MKSLIYFYSQTCAPCLTMGPVVNSVSSTINVFKIDVGMQPNEAIKYGVRSVPTIILMENGVEKRRSSGVKSQSELLNFIN